MRCWLLDLDERVMSWVIFLVLGLKLWRSRVFHCWHSSKRRKRSLYHKFWERDVSHSVLLVLSITNYRDFYCYLVNLFTFILIFCAFVLMLVLWFSFIFSFKLFFSHDMIQTGPFKSYHFELIHFKKVLEHLQLHGFKPFRSSIPRMKLIKLIFEIK